MNTVCVKKTSNIQVVEIQITLQDGHYLVNYNEIHEKYQAFVHVINEIQIIKVWITEDVLYIYYMFINYSTSSLTNQITPFEGNNIGYSMLQHTLWQSVMMPDDNLHRLSAERVCMQRSTVSGSALVIDIDDREEL